MSVYDPIARIYDPWSTGVTEDISFYVEEARTAGGLVVELGVGTGRIAIPTAMAGVHVIGVEKSEDVPIELPFKSHCAPGRGDGAVEVSSMSERLYCVPI